MKKLLLFTLLFFLNMSALATEPNNLTQRFNGRAICFILFDLTHNRFASMWYTGNRCKEQVSPDATFELPLSLMAFDQRYIISSTIFKWDGNDTGQPNWNKDQTPRTWLENSVLWVSQQLTPQLGMEKIKDYLKKFNYGNQDFSGDLGKNNGITKAWLSSSLKISPIEQLNFLKSLIQLQFPISKDSMIETKKNMLLGVSPRGWTLYGKMGVGTPKQKGPSDEDLGSPLQDGWFIGFIEKDNQTYIFVVSMTASVVAKPNQDAGTRAKELVEKILTKLEIF